VCHEIWFDKERNREREKEQERGERGGERMRRRKSEGGGDNERTSEGLLIHTFFITVW